MKRLILTTLFLTLISGLARGATTDDSWENLKQLRVGQNIEVVDMSLKSLKGTFVGVSEEAVSLRVGQNEVAVERPDVLRVSVRERSKRGRNALIGAAIGAGAAVPFVAIGCALSRNEGGSCLGPAAGWIGASSGAGAGLGAAIPSYPTIYRVKKRRGNQIR